MSGSRARLVDLSHPIVHGMTTYPGLPVPVVATHLSRQAAEEVYGPGVTFHIGMVTLCTNTGTYLDVPFHRFADGHDLADLPLERVAAVPAVCLDRRGEVSIDLALGELEGLARDAVLVRTDHSDHFGTPVLRAGIPIIEHLTNLAALPSDGFTFTAVPPKIRDAGTFTVRAYATLV